MSEVKKKKLHRNLHLLGSQMQQKNALMFDFWVNSKMFTITMFPRAGNKQEINILGAEFSRFAELEAQKFGYVNM